MWLGGDKSRMKYQCIKTDSCNICGQKGTIQAFLNSSNFVKYARTRHYKKGTFTYCKLENLREIEELLKSQTVPDHGQVGQENSRSNNLSNSSSNHKIVAGGEGFEPSTPNLGGWCSLVLSASRQRKNTRPPQFRESVQCQRLSVLSYSPILSVRVEI